MSFFREELWMLLVKNNIVSGDLHETEALDSPWYINVLIGFSGWLAALFLLLFLAFGFWDVLKDSAVSAILSAGMIVVSYFIIVKSKGYFGEQMGLAISLAGQAILIFSFIRFEINEWLFILILEILLAYVIPNFVHRVIAAFIATFAFAMTMSEIMLPYLSSGIVILLMSYLWLNEFTWSKQIEKIRPIAYGITLSLVHMKGSAALLFDFSTFGKGTLDSFNYIWISEILIAATLIYVVYTLLKRYQINAISGVGKRILFFTLLLGMLSIEANGVTTGVLILVLGFSNSNKTLQGIGISSLLFYISAYYYFLEITLIEKSVTLMLLGILFLSAHWVLKRYMPMRKGESHA